MKKLAAFFVVLGIIVINYSYTQTINQTNTASITNTISASSSSDTSNAFTFVRIFNRFNFNRH